jgi:hypothetical protein
VTGVAKAIEWERTTPRDQVIAEFTTIIDGRSRNESTQNLQYWKSVGVASTGGAVSDADFTQWAGWLNHAGIVTGDLEPSKYYTNDLNQFASTGTG